MAEQCASHQGSETAEFIPLMCKYCIYVSCSLCDTSCTNSQYFSHLSKKASPLCVRHRSRRRRSSYLLLQLGDQFMRVDLELLLGLNLVKMPIIPDQRRVNQLVRARQV